MQKCGAQLDPIPGKQKHWECDGKGLIVVVPASSIPPVVIKRELLRFVDYPTALFVAEHGWTWFKGGDHIHVCLPGINQQEVTDVG